jgi:hypothetical protein
MAGRVDEKSRPDWSLARGMHGHATPVEIDLGDSDAEFYLDPFLAARIFQQQRIEAFPPDLEAHSGFVRTVVPGARLRTAPAHGMTGHPQKPGALDRLAQLQKVQERQNARCQRLADSIAGKFAFLQHQNPKAESR